MESDDAKENYSAQDDLSNAKTIEMEELDIENNVKLNETHINLSSLSISSTNKPEDFILKLHGMNEVTGTFDVQLNLSRFKRNFSFKTLQKMAIIGFCLSFFDLGSDGWLSGTFLNGAEYTKTVYNISDPSVTNPDFECTKIAITQHLDQKNQTSWTYICFEPDPIWGSLKIAIMMYSGLCFVFYNGPILSRKNQKESGFATFIQKLVFWIFFPFILLILKFLAIFTNEDDWKRASMIVTGKKANIAW